MNGPADQPHPEPGRSAAAGPLVAPDYRALFESFPGLVMVLLPDAPRFTIATCTDAYLAATLTQRSIFGRGLFEVFPDNPDDPAADGVRNLRASLERVLAHRRADTMALQKYDVERPDGSGFEEKWWSPVNTPLIEDGEVRYIVHVVSDVTDEVLLERKSERQGSLLATLVDAMPSGVVAADATGKILVNNPAAKAITQSSTADIPADPDRWVEHFGTYTPEGRRLEPGEAPLERALKGETVGQHELLIRNPRNGAGVHVTVAARPLLDVQGAQIGALAVFTDIGGRVASERALAESEARYKTLADNSPAMIIRCLNAPGWPMLFCSKAAEEITGYPPEEFTERGRLYGSLVLEEDGPALVASVEQQLAKGRDVRVQYRIRRQDGRVRWIEGFARLTTLPDGREGFEGTNTDITASKNDERELAERAEALQRAHIAIDAAHIAAFIWQMQDDLLEISPLAESFLGFAPGEMDGTLAGSLKRVHPDDRDAVRESFDSVRAGAEPRFSFEFRTVSALGRVRWVRARGALSLDDEGHRQAVGAMMDATVEIEVQRALEARTREMERANTELDEFTYIASHDLKEPLRGIHNYASFLAEDYADKLDAGGQHMLAALGQQAGRMQRLIEDLLEIARLGREPMRPVDTDLDAVLDEVLASLDFTLRDKKAELRRSPLGRVDCDRVRVAEVFRNLVTNALKYNDKPTPLIEIGRRRAATGPDEFFVRDNGIGIKSEFHARVFAPFKRLHAKDAYGGGTGVGLAIVKRIVEAHQGHIYLESAPGAGATFAFTLSEETPA